MHSLIPLSLFVSLFASHSFLPTNALRLPFEVHHADFTSSHNNRLGRREAINLTNVANAQYVTNVTIGGVSVRVMLDTGSSDLWVNFPDTVPTTTSLGKSLSLTYAIGSAGGEIVTADLTFDEYSVDSQAFLLVTDASTFSTDIHTQGYDGLMGLGPNDGSQILDKIDSSAGNSVMNGIFTSNSFSSNYITFLLNRNNDPSQNFTGQLTVGEIVPEFSNITNQPKIDVETVHKLLEQEQHWQALTDTNNGIIGPDGLVIQYDSIVPKAPDGQLVAVFDSGFTFNQVPRDISDAIYGRVQNAVYDSTNQWWTVPCGQMLNVTLNFGNQAYPISPLDTVDDSFGITNSAGDEVCIGTFQPITSAFSLLGNYDMIMGMSFLRNAYALLNYGDWVDGSSDSDDPYIQLMSITDVETAHSAFVTRRLNGVDTTGDSQWDLLPASEIVHSPVSAEEKKEEYQEMILSRWPYILAGCLVAVALIVGLIIWRCCCRRKPKAAAKKKRGLFSKQQVSQAYLPLTPQGSVSNLHQAEQGYKGFNGH